MKQRSRVGLRMLGLAATIATIAAFAASPVGASGRRHAAVHRGGAAGGSVTFAAEQELDCADWIASCAGSSWGNWTYAAFTMPRPFEQNGGKYTPSVLLKGQPKLDPGPPQKVTYEISDKAVWNDNQPITSHDFKYTWAQIVNGTDIYDKTGYKNIQSIDDSNPKVAVVTYAPDKPYAAWRDLFGGFYGIFPSHLLEGRDRDALTKDGYDWSGGPYTGRWTKGDNITLTANPNWYGPKPKIQTVIFKFITDTAAESQAFKTAQVTAAYPQPQAETAELFKVQGAKHFVSIHTTSLEALWLNADHFPFQSAKVRQAIAYSLDRDAIVKALFGPIGVDKASQSLNFDLGKGSVSEGYFEPAFAKYHKDLKMVDKLMKSDGWKKNGSGIWEKGGKAASFTLASTTGNKRRETMEDIVRGQLKKAGFDVTSPYANEKAGTLFGQTLPKGNFDAAIYAQVATLDPSLCPILCVDNIPTQSNDFSGQNWTRLNSKKLDKPWADVDKELDVSKRNKLVKQGGKVTADEVPAVPLYPLPNVGVWDGSKLSGPIGDNPTYGMFWNVYLWTAKG